jgi:hypothetical protein
VSQVFINFAKMQTDLLDDEIEDVPDDLKARVERSSKSMTNYFCSFVFLYCVRGWDLAECGMLAEWSEVR